jgi:hypothetical protein
MILPAPDFKKIDETYNFVNYQAKLERAKAFGYQYVSEAAYRMHYEEEMMLARITRELGYKGDSHMYIFFRQMGWTVNGLSYRENFKYGEGNPDFEKLDKTMRMSYLADKMKCVRELGYTYFHEAIWDMYYNQKKSFSQIGTKVGYYHHNSLNAVFRKLNWPRRPRGGANFGSAIREYRDEIYQLWLEWDDKEKKAIRFCEETAKKYNCSVHTIKSWVYRDGWRRDSLAENNSAGNKKACKNNSMGVIC